MAATHGVTTHESRHGALAGRNCPYARISQGQGTLGPTPRTSIVACRAGYLADTGHFKEPNTICGGAAHRAVRQNYTSTATILHKESINNGGRSAYYIRAHMNSSSTTFILLAT